MLSLSELQRQYYEEFRGLPGNCPIVRNNQENDAFELVVLKVLYGKSLPEFNRDHILELSDYIIAPPDNGIDIFFQRENGDESFFDVIQVKNTSLDEAQLRDCILGMERTIEDYCKDPRKIKSESCKAMLSRSNLDKTNKDNCTYYVVHTGTANDFSGSNENEKILTLKSLEVVYKNLSEYVDKDEITITASTKYGSPEGSNGAIVCSLNGYDLAKLCNTYYNTEAGRNILFGSNLRESLITKRAKTFLSMSQTIKECPEKFWFYNNGITIIAKDTREISENKIELRGFSIVNGAQTTSALGLFLREAEKNNDTEEIELLKKVYVLARILKVPDKEMRQDIAIYNNSQNPITSRDMVANRKEQKHLNEWLLNDEYAQIYCEVRRGSQIPANFNRGFTHRKTTNEELAQLAYAAFLQKPFTAKDKKSSLFNNDYTNSEFVINQTYHDIFNWDEEHPENNGLIFQKSKQEIDEALFAQQLYKECKRLRKNELSKMIDNYREAKDKATTTEEIKSNEDRIESTALMLNTVAVCMFYFMCLYYEFKCSFGASGSNAEKIFDFERYYHDREFKNNLIKDASQLFLANTAKVLIETARQKNRTGNISNWVKSKGCEEDFLPRLREEIAYDYSLQDKCTDFWNKYCK